MYSTRSQFNNCWVIIVHQATIRNKSSTVPAQPPPPSPNHCKHAHVWSPTFTPFQMSRGGCEWFGRHKQCVEVFLHFKLQLNALGILSVSTENSKGLRWIKLLGSNPKIKCLHTYADIKLFVCFGGGVGGNSLLKFVQDFRYTLYNVWAKRCSLILQHRIRMVTTKLWKFKHDVRTMLLELRTTEPAAIFLEVISRRQNFRDLN
jgi:hypothetical protein